MREVRKIAIGGSTAAFCNNCRNGRGCVSKLTCEPPISLLDPIAQIFKLLEGLHAG